MQRIDTLVQRAEKLLNDPRYQYNSLALQRDRLNGVDVTSVARAIDDIRRAEKILRAAIERV